MVLVTPSTAYPATTLAGSSYQLFAVVQPTDNVLTMSASGGGATLNGGAVNGRVRFECVSAAAGAVPKWIVSGTLVKTSAGVAATCFS